MKIKNLKLNVSKFLKRVFGTDDINPFLEEKVMYTAEDLEFVTKNIRDHIEYLEEKMNVIITGAPNLSEPVLRVLMIDLENLIGSRNRYLHMMEIITQKQITIMFDGLNNEGEENA